MSYKRDSDIRKILPNAITRRDVLHGMGAGLMATMLPEGLLAAEEVYAPEKEREYYPPTRHGLRGSHPGSFEVAHRASWQGGKQWSNPQQLDETYDLVVVGGGISGLAAAYYYRKEIPKARVLILENHDDFGGHAQRNEYHHDGMMRLAPGGSVVMVRQAFSQLAHELVAEIGIDMQSMIDNQEPGDWRYRKYGLESSIFFDAKTYGRSVTLTGNFIPLAVRDDKGAFPFVQRLDEMPFSDQAKREFRKLYLDKTDCMPGLSPKEKEQALHRTSYYDFLTENAGVSTEVANFFVNYTSGSPGLLVDSLETLYCLTRFRLPGLSRLGEFGAALEERLDSYPNNSLGAYFPDGNAGMARLLVAHLIPKTADARDMNSVVDARFDYARLDERKSPVRLRLNSTVVHVKEKSGSHPVEVTYVRGGKAQQVKARHCVLACYNRVIPYLCPELPKAQKEALADGVKVPLVSSSVMLRSSDPLLKLNSAYFYSPNHIHNETMGIGRELGNYNDTLEPGQPTALFMIGAFLKPHTGLTPREQFRAGRARLLSTSFETLALEIKTHLSEMLAPGGFDAERDIVGLTVNRWPHGYSYVYRSNFDPDYPPGEAPHEIGRQCFGSIAIANSDAGANPMANEAVDQAYRAVHELL